jgi:hypothetical protein
MELRSLSPVFDGLR